MADAMDSKSIGVIPVWVRLPPSAPQIPSSTSVFGAVIHFSQFSEINELTVDLTVTGIRLCRSYHVFQWIQAVLSELSAPAETRST